MRPGSFAALCLAGTLLHPTQDPAQAQAGPPIRAPIPGQARTAASPAAAAPAPATAPVSADTTDAFSAGDARIAVTTLANDLESLYVFPDIGRRYAAMLRANLSAGKYDRFAARAAFAAALTADLKAINADGHLIVRAAPPRAPNGQPRASLDPIARAGWIAPGVAYIAFRAFTGSDAEVAAVRTFMDVHKDARALIIDARDHHGGGLDEMNVIFSYLYPVRTQLVVMDQRVVPGVQAFDFGETMIKSDGPDGMKRQTHYALPGPKTALASAKVILLTSNVTASAGEHLSLTLKRTHRATLIGETTRGAGHFGQRVELGGGYTTFIGTGRTFDPDTGKDWEGVGVTPDVAVPADQALDVALRQLGVTTTGAEALASLH